MNHHLITCLVLTYKNFDNVFLTINSILNQDYPCIEIGVFDDGSDNFPREKICEYIEKNKKNNIKNIIVYGNNKNVGTVKNINNAIKMTKGDYIITLSPDDGFYGSNSCTQIVDFFINSRADIVTSFRQIVNNESTQIGIIPSRKSAKRLSKMSAYEQYKWIAFGAPFAGAGTYYSRHIIEKYNGFDEDYVLQEDGPFFLRATREGTKIHFFDAVTYKYMIGNGVSSGSNNNPLLVKDVKKMFEKEIIPYFSMFSFFEKRRIHYEIERISLNKKLSGKELLRIIIKYPEVILFRKLYAH